MVVSVDVYDAVGATHKTGVQLLANDGQCGAAIGWAGRSVTGVLVAHGVDQLDFFGAGVPAPRSAAGDRFGERRRKEPLWRDT